MQHLQENHADQQPSVANLPNQYSALCWKPVTHAQTWASYSTLYRFGRLSPSVTVKHHTSTQPYSKSRRQVWHTFFILAQLWQTSVFLKRIRAPGHHRKTVNGRAHVLHSLPYRSLVCKYKKPSAHTAFCICRLSNNSAVYTRWSDLVANILKCNFIILAFHNTFVQADSLQVEGQLMTF